MTSYVSCMKLNTSNALQDFKITNHARLNLHVMAACVSISFITIDIIQTGSPIPTLHHHLSWSKPVARTIERAILFTTLLLARTELLHWLLILLQSGGCHLAAQHTSWCPPAWHLPEHPLFLSSRQPSSLRNPPSPLSSEDLHRRSNSLSRQSESYIIVLLVLVCGPSQLHLMWPASHLTRDPE
jgi:hypothetical protein